MPNVSEWITVAGAGGLVTADDFNNTVRDNFHGLYDKKDNEIKHYCGYCPGMTFDDSRGHCCACGGPRVEASQEPARHLFGTYRGELIYDEQEWRDMGSMPGKHRGYHVWRLC